MGRGIALPQSTAATTRLQIPPRQQPCETHLPPPPHSRQFAISPRRRSPTTTAVVVVAGRAPVHAAAASVSSPGAAISTSENIVRAFYDGINRRDLASVGPLIAEDCVYDDLVFSKPFVGRKAIVEFFGKFMGLVSSDFKFRIDDMSAGDSDAVGLTWHLEWQGRPFPFSRGCSFYRLGLRQGKKQIVYGRDCVEPAIKPGESTLVIIQGIAWILQRFPQLVNLM